MSPAWRGVHYVPLKAHNVGLGSAGLGTTGILGAAKVVHVTPSSALSATRTSGGLPRRGRPAPTRAVVPGSPP